MFKFLLYFNRTTYIKVNRENVFRHLETLSCLTYFIRYTTTRDMLCERDNLEVKIQGALTAIIPKSL